MPATKIGIIGCGVISGIYIETSQKIDAIDCVAVADVNLDAARHRAGQYGIARACTPDELLADPSIEIVINLTPNRLHFDVGMQIVAAGKSVYGEKPLCVHREQAQQLLAAARERGVRVGGAPDTFFGGAWQTARKAIDDGLIGQPFAAAATFQAYREQPGAPRASSPTRTAVPGATSFFAQQGFKYGVTVPFDMGPYYLHALINLLGPFRAVSAMTRTVREEIEHFGVVQKVESPTHVAGLLELRSGVLCQYLTSSDIPRTDLPHLEIYGTEGTLRCPDPNVFPGPVLVRGRTASDEWAELPCQHSFNQDSRGVGAADMAVAIRNGRPHRAAGEMAAHAVDVVNALHESAESGRRVELTTTCERPAALLAGLANWTLPD